MDLEERTRDIYEQIKGYPKPPLVPLPELDDMSSLNELGLKSGRVYHWLLKGIMRATGLKAFQKQLPNSVEDLLRRTDLRGGYLFTPVISATLALEDDPRKLSAIERAATLIQAARSLYNDIMSGTLEADRHRGQVLEMGQYANLFSTSLVVDNKKPRLFKSTNTSHIIIAIARRFYSFEIGNPAQETILEQLTEALTSLALTAQENRLNAEEPSPGILTCADHATQCRIFHRLQKIPTNAESLSLLRNSFLTLCLDFESAPSAYAEAARLAHCGNYGNRWYHSSLQLVVFGNAKACTICNFNAYLDGNTMMRGAAELQKRAIICPVESGQRTFIKLPPAAELRWKIEEKMQARAVKDLQSVTDNQQATFEIENFGRSLFATDSSDVVSMFILALQLTAKRLSGKMVKVTQFLSMSKYCCMDLVTAMVTTPEVVRFVDYMESNDVEYCTASRHMREAINSQKRECQRARRYLPLDDIIGLFGVSRTGIQRMYASCIAFLAALLLFNRVEREVIVSHPEIYPEVPVVGRPGIRLPYVKLFGLHYQILANKTVVTMMPSTSWRIPNAELIADLRKSLMQIQSIAQHTLAGA